MPLCLIGLGSNLGDRRAMLDQAVERLQSQPQIRVVAESRWHETPPVGGPPGQASFLNGAVLLETSLSPEALLSAMLAVEAGLGRQRGERWGPRTLDLDLLLYGQCVLASPGLVLPHPRMAWRRFVLAPAAEIASEMLHPTTGWTIARLLAHLDTAFPYLAITGVPGMGKTELARRIAEETCGLAMLDPAAPGRGEGTPRDRPGTAWSDEIECPQRRARLLDAGLPQWRAPDRWVISDFWLDQSLAYARVRLASEHFEEFRRRWEQLAGSAMRPKLIVVLEPPADRGPRGSGGVQLHQTILGEVRGPDRGPVLYGTGGALDGARQEVIAAIEAMQ